MSITTDKRRAAGGAAVLAVAALGLFVGAGSAAATGAPPTFPGGVPSANAQNCSVNPGQFVVQPVGLEHPLLGATGDMQLPGKDGHPTIVAPTKVAVGVNTNDSAVKAQLKAGCKFTVQLDLYATQGPTWPTSGTQTFVGDVMFTIDKDHTTVQVDFTKLSTDACFVQFDLLDNAKLYDGKHNPVPHYNDVHMDGLIAGWNGPNPLAPASCGKPSPSPSPSVKPSTTPSSGKPTPSTKPSTSASPSASVSASASESPSESPSPESSMSVAPGVQLAHTGGSGANPLIIGSAASALVVAGGAAMFMTRRRGRFQR